jgi:transposase
LLRSDAGEEHPAIAEALGIGPRMVGRVVRRYHAGGLARALYDASRARPKAVAKLNNAERRRLAEIIDADGTPTQVLRRARALQLYDQGWKFRQIKEATGLSRATIGNIIRRFCAGRLDRALYDAPSGRPPATRRAVAG